MNWSIDSEQGRQAHSLTKAWTCGGTLVRTLLPHLTLVYGFYFVALLCEAVWGTQASGVVCVMMEGT